MKKRYTSFLVSIFAAFGVFSFASISDKVAEQQVEKAEAADYYASISDSDTGSTLQSKLKTIINNSSVSVSYDWSRYEAADEDPNNSSNVILVYARNSVAKTAHVSGNTGWNREHTFPQSKMSSSQAEKDNHIIFASDNKVNGARSNIKMGVVTGGTVVNDYFGNPTTCRKTSSLFDPNNVARGIVARSTMYAAAMYDYDPTDNFESIATMLRWHLEYPVSSDDERRNETVYSNQKNRNPFVDHPEYACRIWGGTNSTTQSICDSAAGITISATSASVTTGSTITLSATSSNSGTITWTTSNASVAKVNNASSTTAASGSNVTVSGIAAGTATITASVTINSTTYSKTCTVTVSAPGSKTLSSISLSGQTTSFTVGDTFAFGGTVTANYSDSTSETVTASTTFTGYNMSVAGNYTVTASYTYGGTTKTATYSITVNSSGGGGETTYTLVTSNSSLSNGDKVVIKTQESTPRGVTGWNGTNDATVSTTEGDWIQYTVSSASNSGWKLYDSTAGKYVASPTGNHYKYDTSGGTVSVDSSGHFVCNSRYLCVNGTYYRCYTGIGSYVPFYIYKVTSSTPTPTLSSITLNTDNVTKSFYVNDTFTYDGLVVTAHYSDDSSAIVTPSSVSSPNMSTSGNKTVTVTYLTVSETYQITVNARTLSSITISGQTTSFAEGDTFAFGGTVTAHYSDSSTADVTSSATFTGYSMTTTGNQTVTVTYNNKTTTYQITVNQGTLSSIAVSGQTTAYVKNATFSFNGTCTATFVNGYQKIVSPTSVSSPNMSTLGNQTVTVSYTYNGITRSTTYQITISSSRVVIEEVNATATITWASSDATVTGDFSATVTNVQNTYYESNSMRIGTGSGGGQLRIVTTDNITSVVITAKAYSETRKGTLTVGDQSINVLSTSYTEFAETVLSTPTNNLLISTASSSVRINIQSIVVNCHSSEDISSSSDCTGLEAFIDTYMHMDYVENLGYCADSTHHYYSTAKTAFNNLNSHQRSLFTSNSAYLAEWTRLSTWASKNGDSLNSNNVLALGHNASILGNVRANSSTIIIVVITAAITAIGIGGYFLLRKKKEN